LSVNTRLVAAKVLTDVIQNGHSLTSALATVLPTLESSKDQAFIQALCYGVCRQYHRLQFILSEILDKPIKDISIQVLALVGLYQLNFMRVKPHAAVSETVFAVRKKPWAKSLINAILRTYLREQSALELKADQQASAACSHPDWLIGRIRKDWPEYAQAILFENNQPPPMVLRVNSLKTTPSAYLARLAEQGIDAVSVDFCPSALRLNKPVAVDLLPNFSEGWVSVQDTAAQLAAALLQVQAGQRVLDACAAPGGKTAHILEAQSQLKELVAVDNDALRLQRVSENLLRLNLSATLILGDAAKPEEWWDGQLFERILLDAPCSALGVIRRHPDIKLLRRAEDIAPLQVLQQAMLMALWPLLAAGGLLLYATCSILKRENELQIQQFLTTHDDAVAVPIHADWGIAGIGRQILTGELAMDGFYYALLRKH
jgi:16S rRNA (cytosine967-C5)-methyltransferase